MANIELKPLEKQLKIKKVVKVHEKPLKGHEYGFIDYFSMLIVGRSGKGKSTLVYNILPKISSKKTTIIILTESINDPIFIALADRFENVSIEYADKEGLEKTLEYIKSLDESPLYDSKGRRINKCVLCIDDAPNLCSNEKVINLTKLIRHHASSMVIVSHNLKEKKADAKQLCRYVVIFSGYPKRGFKYYLDMFSYTNDKDALTEYYANLKPKDFLFINKDNGQIIKNFTHELVL